MKLAIKKGWQQPKPKDDEIIAFLKPNTWDDHGFRTTFRLELVLPERVVEIGNVSIAFEGMPKGKKVTSIPDCDKLPEDFFSLGFGEEYYWNLKRLGDPIRECVLVGLRDLAYDIERFNALLLESDRDLEDTVIQKSLLRHNRREIVGRQLHRIAHGGVRFLGFELTVPVDFENLNDLTFNVQPESCPPSNVHAIIGSNGVGKTYLISEIVESVIDDYADVEIHSEDDKLEFLNVVLVAFSPFDWNTPFDETDDSRFGESDFKFVGLARPLAAEVEDDQDNKYSTENKSSVELREEFERYVEECKQGDKLSWLRAALTTLESDPVLSSNSAYLHASQAEKIDPVKLADEFSELSSGHKIVLLTIAALVAEVHEGTLVLVDEPENHLHPPLLSSFIRALSELLHDRNGLAVVGTHSPVVLQEIPRNCVWKIHRSGDLSTAERPLIETFGENVGVLTREVFGLQVKESGFYKMLSDAAGTCDTYEQVLEKFGGALGGEAKALVRALLANKE